VSSSTHARGAAPLRLSLSDDDLSSCVACGLCLPHCPTFRVSGEEAMSPRGRIAAMRAVQWEGLVPGADFVHSIDTCVQCRGCETACPSAVPFGRLMEGTRAALARDARITPRWQRAGFAVLGHHRVLLAGSTLLAVAQRARLVPRRFGLPRLPLRRGSPVRGDGGDAWLFTGCVMDAWQRRTHAALATVLHALGIDFAVPRRGAACCGALHVHAGLDDAARRLARAVIASMPGDAPIVVDSAGCGAALKDYGHLLGTEEAGRFAARVRDVHEFLAPHVGRLSLRRLASPVIVQDPCHLRHVQRAHQHVRTVVGAVAEVVELDDEGLCCGAGGAFSALHPVLAADIRARKLMAIARARDASGATVVASGNPGCALHLAAAGLDVRHPVDLLAEGLR
jgi:glycolate oxidase iron-sulfur subunit